METLRVKSVELSLKEERDKRKSRAEERKETESKKQLLDALKERNLNLCPRVPFDRPELMDMARLTVSLPLMHSVSLIYSETLSFSNFLHFSMNVSNSMMI